ncbi:uncharacterized protein LOC131737055 [Acipenser ruthenus]|uniref:uncharacterized protein LOC131737055 n=1 Tax=Acipenser ruthenus TaxID=7906 RepID=UPI0027412B5B|nr:uncharacterized protein LOC131737055 [Acipenser ruthenus]
MLDRTPCTRLSCFAHTLQLVVRDGIKKPSVYTRAAMGKYCKLANLSHESTIFREAFENTFGAGRSIPSTNSTRWNSLHRQIKIIVSLDQYKLGQLLREQQLEHLLPTPRDHAALTEFVNVLQAFAEATDLVQGDQYTTIGSVMPSVIALHRHLKDLHGLIRYQRSLVDALLQSLHIRFSGLFNLLQITQDHSDRQDPKPFSEMLYPMASVLDPTFGFLWLEADHPGNDQMKSKIREEIIDEIVNQVDLMCPREIAGP